VRKIDGCLHIRKHVLTAVLSFASQGRNLLLISLLLGNIPRDFRMIRILPFGSESAPYLTAFGDKHPRGLGRPAYRLAALLRAKELGKADRSVLGP
jgi:hypothetical protein